MVPSPKSLLFPEPSPLSSDANNKAKVMPRSSTAGTIGAVGKNNGRAVKEDCCIDENNGERVRQVAYCSGPSFPRFSQDGRGK